MPDDVFHQAVTAIDAGDAERLKRLLDAHPSLATDRLEGSPEWLRSQVGDAADGFFRRPYLLWFVAEDPVRNGRLPSNVDEIIHVIAANEPSADLYVHGTPLHHAVCSGSLETVKVLVLAGADPLRPDSAWEATALGWAEHYVESSGPQRRPRYSEILTYLREVQGLSPLEGLS